VLLFPSSWPESYGLTVREALARDVWVIASAPGGQAEDIVAGVNGTLIRLTAGVDTLVAAVTELLDRPDRLAGHVNPAEPTGYVAAAGGDVAGTVADRRQRMARRIAGRSRLIRRNSSRIFQPAMAADAGRAAGRRRSGGRKMIARCQEVAPCADPADAAGIVAQKFDLDEGAVGRARDRQPVDMHRIDGNEAARPSCIVSPGCGGAQARRADGRAQAQFAVQDDFGLVISVNGRASTRWTAGWASASALKHRNHDCRCQTGWRDSTRPQTSAGRAMIRSGSVPGVQRAEYAVIGEQDPVGAPGAAGGQKMLPGAEIQAAIGPCMRDDAVIGAETGDIGCDMVDARECEMHRHAAGGEFGQIMTGVGAQQPAGSCWANRQVMRGRVIGRKAVRVRYHSPSVVQFSAKSGSFGKGGYFAVHVSRISMH
jgi:hypothetical protein